MIMSKSSSQLADTAFLTSHRQARGFWHLEICSMRASFHGILSLDSRDEIKNIVPFDWPFRRRDRIEWISRFDQGLL